MSELSGKQIVIFLGPDFEDREVVYPYYRFLEAGATVKLAGIGDTQYKGKYGIPLTVDGQCEDFMNTSWDAVIIPGGWAPDKIRMNQAALEITRKAVQSGKVVAAICHGGWVLASARVIDNKQVTSYVAIKDDMIHAGGQWVDQEVVVDSGIVTSRTPADLPAFCRSIIGQLAKVPAAV